jgi:hypothetical protein
VAFTASYGFGFKNPTLTGRLNGQHPIVDDFNIFEDGSGRSPYFTGRDVQEGLIGAPIPWPSFPGSARGRRLRV